MNLKDRRRNVEAHCHNLKPTAEARRPPPWAGWAATQLQFRASLDSRHCSKTAVRYFPQIVAQTALRQPDLVL
jgi:hypothetical protein